jgi:hypothetical protein
VVIIDGLTKARIFLTFKHPTADSHLELEAAWLAYLLGYRSQEPDNCPVSVWYVDSGFGALTADALVTS